MLTQLYRFQTTTGLDTFAKVDTAKREHNDVCDGSLPCRCSLPTLKASCWCHPCSSRACTACRRQASNCGSCPGRSLGVLLQRQGFPQGSPGCEQVGQPARDQPGCIPSTHVGCRQDALRFPGRAPGPQWVQIHLHPCPMWRAEQHQCSVYLQPLQ